MTRLTMNADYYQPLENLLRQATGDVVRRAAEHREKVDVSPITDALASKCLREDPRRALKKPSQDGVKYPLEPLQEAYAAGTLSRSFGNRRLYPLPMVGGAEEEAVYERVMGYPRPSMRVEATTGKFASVLYAYRCQDAMVIRLLERKSALAFLSYGVWPEKKNPHFTAAHDAIRDLLLAEWRSATTARNALAVALNDPLILSELREVIAVENFSKSHDFSFLISLDGSPPAATSSINELTLKRELRKLLRA